MSTKPNICYLGIDTCEHLDTNFELLRQYNLKMPWNIIDTIKIYKIKS